MRWQSFGMIHLKLAKNQNEGMTRAKTELPGHDCVSRKGNPFVAPIITSIAGVATGTIAGIAKEEETRYRRNSFFKQSTGNALAGTDAEVAKMSESGNLISLKLRLLKTLPSPIATFMNNRFAELVKVWLRKVVYHQVLSY